MRPSYGGGQSTVTTTSSANTVDTGAVHEDFQLCLSLCVPFDQLRPIIYDLWPTFALCCHLRCRIKYVPILPIIIRTPSPLSLFPRPLPPLPTVITALNSLLEARNGATQAPHESICRPRGSDAASGLRKTADQPRHRPRVPSISCSCRLSFPPLALSRSKITQSAVRFFVLFGRACVLLSSSCHGSNTNGRTPDLSDGCARNSRLLLPSFLGQLFVPPLSSAWGAITSMPVPLVCCDILCGECYHKTVLSAPLLLPFVIVGLAT